MKPGEIIKTFKSKKGREVIVRTVKRSDLEELRKFANDLIDEDTFIMLSGKKITSEEEKKYLQTVFEQVKKKHKIYLVASVDGKIAGTTDLRRQEKRESHVGEMGISLAPLYRGEGIGAGLFQALIDETKKIGLKLLYLPCFETNKVARSMYEKLGFKYAGVVPGMILFKNQYIGQVTYYLPLENS